MIELLTDEYGRTNASLPRRDRAAIFTSLLGRKLKQAISSVWPKAANSPLAERREVHGAASFTRL
jgi:hypothetical protein